VRTMLDDAPSTKPPTPETWKGGALPGREMHVCYRIFDPEDNLLYVGLSSNLNQRMRQHWWDWLHAVTLHPVIEWTTFTSRKEAQTCEQIMIGFLRPPFNSAGCGHV